MKLLLIIIAVALAVAAFTGRLSFAPVSSDNSKVQNVTTTVSSQVSSQVRHAKRVVTRVIHRISGIGSSGRCSDSSDPTGDDGAGSCGDNGSDDQAGDNVRGGP